MKSERVGGEAELFRHLTGGHPVRSRFAKNIETVILGESAQRRYCVLRFHVSIDTEISHPVKNCFNDY